MLACLKVGLPLLRRVLCMWLPAGRTFVEVYSASALELLLPAVEDGVVHENWRIRQSSTELLGELLFKARAGFEQHSIT